jgi:hypothetical protein
MLATNQKSATIQTVEAPHGMVPLTVISSLVFFISLWVREKESSGDKTRVWSQGVAALRSSGNCTSKPQRWIAVEKYELTVDYGGGRKRLVGAPFATFVFTRLPRAKRVAIMQECVFSCILRS